MMRPIFIFLCVISCGLATACNDPKPQSTAPNPPAEPPVEAATPAAKPPRELGKVVASESVAGSADGAYAYYLPSNYSVDRPVPVLIFFDSHARGKDPVTMYQSLADGYGMLLVGSNNSKNGQQPNQGLSIYDQLIKDLRLKFAIDEGHISVSGFSGGARVAANLAQSRPEIGSVIACSAGYQPQQSDKFNYYAIVGKKDFNYQELRQLEDVLDGTMQKDFVSYWDGGHEWPTVAVMGDAFEFIDLCSMDPADVARDSVSKEVLDRFAAQDKAERNALSRWRLHKGLIAKLGNGWEMSSYKAEMDKIKASKAWADARAADDKAMQEETALRNEYVPFIGTKSIDEWRALVAKLSPNSKPASSEAFFVRHRVLNFLSLNVYFQVDGALKAGDMAAAEHFLQIYALVDPFNPEAPYLTAQVRLQQNRPADAIASLQAAQRLGFKDAERMATDPKLVGIQPDPAFVKLLAELRAL